jgi:hypothetical protein
MCQRKRSASLPVRTGVSLIGLAIITVLFCYHGAKVQNIFEMCTPNAAQRQEKVKKLGYFKENHHICKQNTTIMSFTKN